jgi:hypothetical protein
MMSSTESVMNSKSVFNPSAAVLWASAFIIGALVIIQAGKLPGNPAHADMVADRGNFTAVTANSGRGDDSDPYEVLYIIDSREQMLLVYEVDDIRRKQIVLRDGGNLDGLFLRARQ